MNGRKDEVLNVGEWKNRLEKFADDRDWKQFHNPKNLAMALSVEAGELVEIFQWLDFKESLETANDSDLKVKISDEISDIVVYALRLCSVLDIDLPSSMIKKMEKNEIKYPVEKAKGSSKKYTEL